MSKFFGQLVGDGAGGVVPDMTLKSRITIAVAVYSTGLVAVVAALCYWFLGPHNGKVDSMLYACLLGVAVTSVAVWQWLLRYLMRPLCRLAEQAQVLVEDDHGHCSLSGLADDEIGRLGRSFNKLLDELQRARHACSLSEHRFSAVFNSIPECVTITRSVDGRFLEVNEAFLLQSGFCRDEVIGKTSTELGVWQSATDRLRLLQILEAQGVVNNLEVEMHSRNGRVITMLLSAVPIDFYGEQSLLLTLRDISEKKAVECELQQKQAELMANHEELATAYEQLKTAQTQMLQQEKLASVGLLSAGVAHELNNPIAFIASNLSTLGKYLGRIKEFFTYASDKMTALIALDALKEIEEKKTGLKIDWIMMDIADLITESLEGAERVRSIVKDLKSFSRQGSDEFSSADLNACLESTLNIVWNELKYNAKVTKDLGEIPMTWCNPQQLNQVFLNLLVNASHAIDKEGEITIRTRHEPGQILVTIADNGCGIPPEIRARIFEPFFTTKEVGKGTGLGLSISYDIVQKHGGEIVVDSEVGKGTAFILRLPVCDGTTDGHAVPAIK